MRFFPQAYEIFDCDQSACQAEDHVYGDQPSKLKPCESRAVDAESEELGPAARQPQQVPGAQGREEEPDEMGPGVERFADAHESNLSP